MLKVLSVTIIGILTVISASAIKVIDEVGTSVKFKDCGSVSGAITTVDITPCTPEPCPFKKNTNVTVQVTFTAKDDITTATTIVHGVIEGVPVPFPLPDKDACKHMNCPIKKGSTVVYNYDVPVKASYPDIRLIVKWEVLDQNSKDVICFLVPVEITS